MITLRQPLGRHPLGVWIAILALLSLLMAWAMQAYSLIDWDGAVDLGIQGERFSSDANERAWVRADWGVAVADMLWPMPISIVALIGVLRRRLWGFAAGLMEFAIGVYFPLVFAFQRLPSDLMTVIIAFVLFLIPSLLGIVGLLVNRDHFKG